MFLLGSEVLMAEVQDGGDADQQISTSEKRDKRFSHQHVSYESLEGNGHHKENYDLRFCCYPYIKQNIWQQPDTSVETLFILYTIVEMRYKQIEFVSEDRNQIIKRVKGDSKPYYVRTVEGNKEYFLWGRKDSERTRQLLVNI